MVAGSPQSNQVTTAFSQPLVVLVTDGFGAPIQGETVTFTVPGSGASATLAMPSRQVSPRLRVPDQHSPDLWAQ